MSTDYQKQLYERYVSSGQADAPETIEGLASRRPWIEGFIAKHFPENHDAEIVDLGCGFGALVHFAREAGYTNILGVDISAEQVAVSRRLGIEGVVVGDLFETMQQFPDGSKDMVISLDVVEHLSKNDVLLITDAIQRVLRPGGHWLILVPNGCSPFFGRMRYGDFTHELAFTPQSLSQLLLSRGFREVHCIEVQPIRNGFVGTARWLVWKAIRGILRIYLAAESGETGREVVLTQNLVATALR